MALTQTEKDACNLLLQTIQSEYIAGKLTSNSKGLTGRDLNVPRTKFWDTCNYLKGLPYSDKILKGKETGNHEVMYIVTGGKKNPHLDITGHVIKVSSDGEKTDKTKKAEGKAGAALFNVHVEFNGVSDEKKKQQAEAMEKSKEQQAKFAAKQEAKEKQKAASTMPSNPYDLLLGLDD